MGHSCRPQFYLSLNGLLLFQAVRGGIEYYMGLQPKPWANVQADPHPRPYRSERTVDELSNSSCCWQTAQNGYVVQFSFFGSNVSPFFQILRAIAAILRARVNRAISARMPFCSRPRR